MNKKIRLIIFAKAPIAGLSKTRLIPALGVKGSAQLAKKLLTHSIGQALAADVDVIELCAAPEADSPEWQPFKSSKRLEWSEQGIGDLGERLARAVRRSMALGESVLLMGMDCPGLSHQKITEAADSLRLPSLEFKKRPYDCCIVPVSDGGYALLGLTQYHASLFTDMPWSTDQVTQLSCERMTSLDWSICVLPSLHDIDEPEDLQYLPMSFLP